MTVVKIYCMMMKIKVKTEINHVGDGNLTPTH